MRRLFCATGLFNSLNWMTWRDEPAWQDFGHKQFRFARQAIWPNEFTWRDLSAAESAEQYLESRLRRRNQWTIEREKAFYAALGNRTRRFIRRRRLAMELPLKSMRL